MSSSTDSTQRPDAETLFSRELEFTTESVVRIDGDYFWLVANGGERGAWQDRDDVAELIGVSEARRHALELGYDIETVALATGAVRA